MTSSRFVAALACLATVTATGLAAQVAPTAGPAPATSVVRPRTTYEDLQLLSGVLNQIRVNHPDSVDTHTLLMAAIRGMVSAADPHSYFVQAVQLDPDRERLRRDGKLYPVGIDFVFYDGSPVVRSVAPGSSPARADVLPGDELVAVDGCPVTATSPMELDVAIAGPKGSTVALLFERERTDGSLVQLTRTVSRERLDEVTSVPAAFMLDSATGYARITNFTTARVADDLHAALDRLEKQGMRRLVLDLRDNGGGSVDLAAHVAGEFLPTGALVYTQSGRKREVTDTSRVKRSFWRSERRYPIVVLVNNGTASASELVAGALQDHDRALVVGRPTFGKSLVMYPFPLPDGSLFWMVAGHLSTPCGRVIQRDYRGIPEHEYFRRAGADTTPGNRPSCRTDAGRTVYGGGGIYPDVMTPKGTLRPVWLSRLYEDALPLKWSNGYVSANAASLGTLDAFAARPALPAAAIAQFRDYARAQGAAVPDGADVDALLQRALTRSVADVKWGDAGLYRVSAVLDAEVVRGVAAFARAADLGGAK
jgi:carboxyl-terminal processing protease